MKIFLPLLLTVTHLATTGQAQCPFDPVTIGCYNDSRELHAEFLNGNKLHKIKKRNEENANNFEELWHSHEVIVRKLPNP